MSDEPEWMKHEPQPPDWAATALVLIVLAIGVVAWLLR